MRGWPSVFLLATSSAGKADELRALLNNAGIESQIKTYADFGLEAPEETGATFLENAMIKARAGFEATGLPCLADDSGLCVTGLNDAPGVYSADWAAIPGGERDYAHAMQRIDAELGDKDREAYFICTLILLDGENFLHSEGRVYGTLLPGDAPQVNGNGFGYDPWFVPEGHTQSFGVLSKDVKNALSHRQRAFENLLRQI